ncbi:MAG: hypothetical protein V4858_02085 [Pseudomonadota bacterium]
MTFTTKNRFSITAFAIAATVTTALSGTMLTGFNQLANAGEQALGANNRLVKTEVAPHTVTLERVVITTRRA